MPWITHMLFVDFNYNCSCREFDRLLCNCSVKGCRENRMRKTTRLVCDVTLPATGVDKTDNLPIGISETLHMPRLVMFFTSFDAFILPLEKSGEGEQRDRHVCTGVQCGRWRISFVSRTARICSSQSGHTQNLTLSTIFAIFFCFLCMKNLVANSRLPGRAHGTYEIEKYEWVPMERK